eukprot:Hpha_TRINITY_DN16610_c1_g1::TRINITY_DN16610_c1_g1_i7::g.179901::m.179901
MAVRAVLILVVAVISVAESSSPGLATRLDDATIDLGSSRQRRRREMSASRLLSERAEKLSNELKRVKKVMHKTWETEDHFKNIERKLRAERRAGNITREEYREKREALEKKKTKTVSQLEGFSKELRKAVADKDKTNEPVVKARRVDVGEGKGKREVQEKYREAAQLWRTGLDKRAKAHGVSGPALDQIQKEADAVLAEQEEVVAKILVKQKTTGHEDFLARDDQGQTRERLRSLSRRRKELERRILKLSWAALGNAGVVRCQPADCCLSGLRN